MSNYRKLWLINSLGNRYNFTERETNIFLQDLSGFGFNRNYSVQQLGNSELITSQQFALTDIQGDLLFLSSSNGTKYEAYQNFIQFIKYKPLELHYQTPNVQENDAFHSDVLITQISKGEVDNDGVLHCPIVLHRTSQWLTDKDYTITLTNTSTDDGKYYPLNRPYHYAGTNLSNTIITNNGTDDVGFVITIDGGTTGVQNPTFTLTQSAEQYGVCKITGTYGYVMIDSVEKSETLYLENTGGSVITNPKSYQDFSVANGQSYITWCKFKVGQTIFNFTCGNIDRFDGSITITFNNSYVSV